jgi:hypothetical protein
MTNLSILLKKVHWIKSYIDLKTEIFRSGWLRKKNSTVYKNTKKLYLVTYIREWSEKYQL